MGMFRRPSTRDGDVVAAARRRLAALSLHHESGRAAHASGEDHGPGQTTDPIGVDEGTSSAGPRVDDAARHVAPRRTELGRVGLTGQHVTVVALCVLVLVLVVAWWALRSVPHTDQVTLSSHQTVPNASGGDLTGQATPSSPVGDTVSPGPQDKGFVTGSRLVVDVAGKVRHPGIVELPSGARVVDAIAAAGGARPSVSLTSLNLARPLVDGEQIVVGVQIPIYAGAPPPGGAPQGATTTQAIVKVQLNTATAEQLDTLPGVGPVTAQAILQWRADNGPFTTVDELLEVSGIGDATLTDLRPYVYV